ncbi:extracellular solute-binding protein [Paenibacillus methanolicus]|uniref:Putative aldouronate transport system substrate-binding protein n=1 Tax=Paenibacillus methanolicus TaxID=582686 RepID=A0A5S5CK84_9BACL|nr:extracellular solute-binding protein [Paenibacillus methanolicus]TYP78981.1 putative aldouronate transport system substrate-binding protein [Paenibacillus methanolicus]
MGKKITLVLGSALLASTVLTACSSDTNNNGQAANGNAPATGNNQAPAQEEKPYEITFASHLPGETPAEDNPFEQALEKYTNTELTMQWIPNSGYDDKINVMIASDELPTIVKVSYVPNIISTMQNDIFWEIGPYLKDYKNLAAQPETYYNNIKVDGKIYGIPVFRPVGRAVLHYRKDWFDAKSLTVPKTLDEWYNVMKAVAEGDPDQNGKRDTYGMMLDKNYNQGTASMLTRLSVSQGGPNKWKVDDQGHFTPEFMTDEFFNTMKLFRRLYEEKLINQDFAVSDATTIDKAYESGRVAVRISGGNAQSMQTNLEKVVPTAVMDAVGLEGPQGIRVPGENGNAGILTVPKSSVKNEEELKRVLTFLDQLLDKEMVNLINKGIEGKHYKVEGDVTVPLDKDADAKEVKPYRDVLLQRGEAYNMDRPMQQTPLFKKNNEVVTENEKHAVPNPALTLLSAMYTDRGADLELMITDAETKFIMGKIDEAGWQAEVENWKNAGGAQMMEEYKEAYLKVKP